MSSFPTYGIPMTPPMWLNHRQRVDSSFGSARSLPSRTGIFLTQHLKFPLQQILKAFALDTSPQLRLGTTLRSQSYFLSPPSLGFGMEPLLSTPQKTHYITPAPLHKNKSVRKNVHFPMRYTV